MRSHYLTRLFNPRVIAVIGASDRPQSVGMKVFKNLLDAEYSGDLYAINPKHKQIFGKVCYPSVADVKKIIDLVVITTPAKFVPHLLKECGEQGIHHAIIISSGFSETGKSGKDLERELLDIAHHYKIRLIGPNCLGVMRPSIKMNATFDNNVALPGHIAFVSQSGALSAAILDWSVDKGIGFSTIISMGNSSDIGFGEILDFLAIDNATESILLYIEGIRNARKFMSGLRAAARVKPVIVIKAGRHPQGSRAALSHTGALIGDDDVFDIALKRGGALRVMTIEELFSATEILAGHCRVKGNRLGVITNGGGAGVMAADRAAELNVTLPSLSQTLITELNTVLPNQWSHQNPIDIIGDATPERYHAALEKCIQSDQFDAILAILVPVAMSNPQKVAEQVIKDSERMDKIILASWMGEKQVKSSWKLFEKHRIPYFDTPEKAVQAFSYLSDYQHNQTLLMQVPGPLSPQPEPRIEQARAIIAAALADNRSILTTIESKKILKAFNIPISQAINATSDKEAVNIADSLGYPVVMKINSPDITHKQNVGGVQINVNDADAVIKCFHKIQSNVQKSYSAAKIYGITVEAMFKSPNNRELMIGVLRDIVFGPVISFGMGGTLVEVIKDRALALPPLNSYIAKQLILRTRIVKCLGEFRNMPPVNLELIINGLLSVSAMVCELPEIKEMDINPVIINDQGMLAVDARIVVDQQAKTSVPYEHMAIHPYPYHLMRTYELSNNTTIIIRPIRPEDAEMEQQFIVKLSDQSKYFRFFENVKNLPTNLLIRFTQIDYDRELALIATGIEMGQESMLGVARYSMNADMESCEFAIIISDDWQKKGIGRKLLTSLIEAAKMRGLKEMMGIVLRDNKNMLNLAKQLGFKSRKYEDDHTIQWVIKKL